MWPRRSMTRSTRPWSFDAHGSVFRMTGDSLRELAKEDYELRIRFLDGNGQEMEAVIPLARIKDLVGVNGAFEPRAVPGRALSLLCCRADGI